MDSADLAEQPPISPEIKALAIAVLIPCFNEEWTVRKVVEDFRVALPHATIYVYDNNSTDRTAQLATEAGAVLRHETLQGKGNVVRRMFADVDADVFILVDGDDTYDAASAPRLCQTLLERQADLVTGCRVESDQAAYPFGHRFGNALLAGLVKTLFGDRCADLLSGYRVMTKRFVKSFPALATGFEIETALTVHALEQRVAMADVDTPYKARPAGSESKLRTVPDGIRVMRTIQSLLRYERPLPFFGIIGSIIVLISLALGFWVTREFLDTGQVARFPTAILAVGLMLVGMLSWTIGLVLDSVARSRVEVRRLTYVQHLPPWGR